jgi:hypothetical protein
MHTIELQMRFASRKDPAVDVGVVVPKLNILDKHLHKSNPIVNFVLVRRL